MGLHFKCSLGEWSSPRALSNFCCFTSSQRPYKFGGTTFWAKIEAKDNCVKMSCLLKHIVGLSFTVASWENESMPCGLVSHCFVLLFLLSRLSVSACCRESATVCPLAVQVSKLLAILSLRQKSGATITGVSASECLALFARVWICIRERARVQAHRNWVIDVWRVQHSAPENADHGKCLCKRRLRSPRLRAHPHSQLWTPH